MSGVRSALVKKQLLAADLINMAQLASKKILLIVEGQTICLRVITISRAPLPTSSSASGAPAIVCTEGLHNLMIRMQVAKHCTETRDRFNYFGLHTALHVSQFICDVAIVDCNWTTMSVVMCKMKQAINKFGEPALRELVARAQAQPEVTRGVVLREVATLRRLGVKRTCAAIRVLDAVAKSV